MKHQHYMNYENICLRPLMEDDIEFLREWRNNPANTVYLRKIGYISCEQQKKWYDNYLKNEDEICFAIVETEELNRIVGSASLYNFQNNQAEFGKLLIGDEQAHGRKIGYHAVAALVKYGFEHFNLERIVLECHEKNASAYHIYSQTGFEVVGSHEFDGGGLEYDMELRKEQFYK